MAGDPRKEFKLLSDEPILESDRTDYLEFEHTAKVLSRAALYADSPMTIGIFGNWGSGKTSLMRLMRQVVETEGVGEDAAVAVWFNAWQYEREEHLIVPLIATIARSIKKREEQWDKLMSTEEVDEVVIEAARRARSIMKSGGKQLHDALRSILYGISMKGKLGIPHMGELEISTSMKDMIERYEAVTQDTLMARSLYFDAFDQLRDLSREKNVKKPQIVVFIDDLDRCFPEQAVRLLESVKLVLHQPQFAFVLGIYPQIIEEFIRNKYAAQYPLAAARSISANTDEFQRRMDKYLDYFNDYLGKIIQVRHTVPQRSPGQMQDYIRHLLESADVIDEFLVEGMSESDLFDLIAEVGNRSPREIVRKINGLIVKWRIAKLENHEGKTYDLLAALINETVSDRVAKGKHEYEQFLYRLEWLTGDEESSSYGQDLAAGLKNMPKAEFHAENINLLKQHLNTDDSPTMNSLVELLEMDEHFCNVLNSPAGQRWLSEKKYREELRATYTEREFIEDDPEAQRAETNVPSSVSDDKSQMPRDIEQLIPKIKTVDVPAGEFQMGSAEGSENERPIHTVKLAGFKISATPVTQLQYKAIMGNNPSHFQGKDHADADDRPVENVSWNDAMVFCERLTKLFKGRYKVTLPTESQWEYACRAGTVTPFNTGDNLTTQQANYNGNYPWQGNPSGEYLERTTAVGSYPPNAWGLYDMHGNVWELCQDKWHGDYQDAPADGSVWETGGSSSRVLRGGSWDNSAGICRSANRDLADPGYRNFVIGFRLVFVP